ncbi:MAG: hypothetical protein AAF582_13100, partial [Pseudomonadota bacterium]
TQTAVSIDYINAMRAALGRLHARYQGPQLAAVRDQMVKISRDLAADPTSLALVEALDRLEASLEAFEVYSLYEPSVLSQALR